MKQGEITRGNTLVSEPRGFTFVAGLCILIGAMGIVSRIALWLLPSLNFISAQLTSSPIAYYFQAIFDAGYLVGGIFVLKKRNWARICILVVAAAKILEWSYSAIVFKWVFYVKTLSIWAFIPLLSSVFIAIYFSRPSVTAYMD